MWFYAMHVHVPALLEDLTSMVISFGKIWLQFAGAEVLFGIDATKLHKTALLEGKKFDAVVFNFPHTGRKASIKMNRQLLKDFFVR